MTGTSGVMGAVVPTTFIEGYKFRFYSSDGHEPPHMHVLRGDCEAKVWLCPVRPEYSCGYSQSELNRVLRLARQNRYRLLEVWHAHFGTKG